MGAPGGLRASFPNSGQPIAEGKRCGTCWIVPPEVVMARGAARLGLACSCHPRGTGTSWSAATGTSEPPGGWDTFSPLPLRACIDKSVGLESALVLESRIESGTFHGGFALTHGS